MADFVDHKSQTEGHVNAVRQVLVCMKEQLDAGIVREVRNFKLMVPLHLVGFLLILTEVRNVSNSLAECKNQMESER
jgi:hypothetical protein